MKTRQGFVSNSSSASFVIRLDLLTKTQQTAILGLVDPLTGTMVVPAGTWGPDWWHVDLTQDILEGDTSMDNGALSEFLRKLEVPTEACTLWDDANQPFPWGEEERL